MPISQWLLVILGGLVLTGFVFFGLVSLREGEQRAAKRSFWLSAAAVALVITLVLSPLVTQGIALGIASLAFAGVVLAFFLPIGKKDFGNDQPKVRFDERDVIFSRFFYLKEGTPEFETYYRMHPEHKDPDALTRTKPGLNQPGSRFYHPVLAAAVDAGFFLTEEMSNSVDGPVATRQVSLEPEDMTRWIKDLAAYFGALHVGVTRLQPHHVYSHIGRGPGEYSAQVEIDHQFAIAITVEMDHGMIGPNPALQGSMESAHQYVESARVAVQLAASIRQLGYPARAHIDGSYRVICPLVARDAGLGEIGRMGLLMTPSHGPRVRLAVVTTNLPLLVDKRAPDASVLDFCSICKKCADCCPSQSIPFGDREEIDGALRWRIDTDTCFRYWMESGTDCGRCMSVCPYSHPNNPAHNLVRLFVNRSGFARRAVLAMDDFFYGRKPARRKAPTWTMIKTPAKSPIKGEK